MRERQVTLPTIALIAGTRAALGAGVGLLLADRLSESQRRAVGWTLLAVGVLTTIPLAFEVLGGDRLSGSLTDGAHGPADRLGREMTERMSHVAASVG